MFETATEEELDRRLFDDYLKKGLVNIKNLVLKNPLHRTEKENEFLILYMKHQFECFFDVEKSAIEMFVQRLSFDVFKAGDVVGKTGQPCNQLVMIIDGEIEAVSRIVSVRDSAASEFEREHYIKTLKEGSCFGEECFESDDYRLPFNLVCSQRAMTLNLKRKDFAEVLLFQKQQTQVNWQKFILEIPFVAAMPYHLVQDVSGILYPQRFLNGEVVYDVGETHCDTLYFVESGKL